MELFPGVVGENEIKANQPNLAWAWPELGNNDNNDNNKNSHLNFLKGTVLGDREQKIGVRDKP